MNVPWLQHMIVVILVAAFPVWDRVETRRVKRSSDVRAKVQSYQRVVAVLWSVTALTLAAMAPNDLLHPPALGGIFARLDAAQRVALPIVAALFVGLAVPVLAALASPSARTRFAKPLESLSWYLPNSPAERRWFAALAVSAGVCEEVLYRGFLLRYLTTLLPAPGGMAAVLVAAVVFALAHTYQGVLGAVATALMALGFTALFVASHSLWLPIMAHALVDLRVLILWRGDSGSAGTAVE
ncbi:MAG TPA: CPBP family intramembrane glutamic endopeptidase [Gemmatimonadaceae bacterium]|nr:CPBP family intramembrane glutamic endopeptidase [Gemmatimonadaceae bacterium]